MPEIRGAQVVEYLLRDTLAEWPDYSIPVHPYEPHPAAAITRGFRVSACSRPGVPPATAPCTPAAEPPGSRYRLAPRARQSSTP